MRVLMVNKSLAPGGGTQTYIFKLGEHLMSRGHEVQYFGMDSADRCVGNEAGAYTEEIDFHNASIFDKIRYSIKTIYSIEARRKIRLVLDEFKPDVVHLNNIYYHLTPSVILEIVKWREENDCECRIVFTVHDYSLVCPNHMMRNPITNENCEKCIGNHFVNCLRTRCIHGSRLWSFWGMLEAYFWSALKVYERVDAFICCSGFLKEKMDTNPVFAQKTVAMLNFANRVEWHNVQKQDYVLYFGRYSSEKGLGTLVEACSRLPSIPFVFAGSGPLESILKNHPNIIDVGFQSGAALEKLVREARFSVYPSEWYENCPFSVIESLSYGTPVLAADIGGIPELVFDGLNGELFKSADIDSLMGKLKRLYEDSERVKKYEEYCVKHNMLDIEEYSERVLSVYTG